MAYSTSTIAQGCFGKVYKEKYNDTWAAVKKVPHNLISKKDLERECEVYNKANHPNIVKLLGNINLRDGKWIIPLEFIFGEDLETTIFKTSKSKIQLTPSIKGTIIIGMCEGLLHLHSKDVVHQDLKPENIMVEHNTNRAVIIDLGLAKFFRYGLNSAVNMGNEAYSAPEVLQERGQRDQRSDVWAMGKIIAELCARVRLYTPTVCPAKIKETLLDQPYCHAVCRMVETDPTLRASMGGVISEIRKAGSAGIVPSAPVQKDHLKPPASQINVRNLSPSPVNRDPSPENRNPSPMNRAPSPFNRDPSPMNRAPSPFNRDPLPIKKAPSPFDRGPSPMNKAPSPFDRDPSPMNKAPSPFNRDPLPIKKAPSPFDRDPLPMNKAPSPLKWECSPRPDFKALNPQAAMHLSPSPQRTEDINKHQALVPAGRTELTQDFMKMKLYQEAAKDLPCNLPTTGRVVIRHFEEKNGEVETWQQKEVVTRDGKIVEFNDIKFNGK
ncbi:CBL-interacting serine/threonine-protein kinase 21 isoform X3 [Sander lucioperca]|uniref:CBL-interacting serine/threonine-protein kinase 21 isoform X3 n=1 Tax=Sander lucioperca TaxID=283035 RepID=UPI00125DB47F|nr:CBL-interacting serine/threonine-protein kinase 21 isoform X3 [Sander lucioperca]